MLYANTKDTDQPVHPHILISIFVVRCLDSIIDTKWINLPICQENGKDYQLVFDTDSSALCPHL